MQLLTACMPVQQALTESPAPVAVGTARVHGVIIEHARMTSHNCKKECANNQAAAVSTSSILTHQLQQHQHPGVSATK
jgi:hypothetical protein